MLGEDRTIVAELEALVAEHPLRERPWHELAVALHRSGRSPDALRRIATFRTILRDELGLDLPAAVRQLESRILESDPALLASSAPLSGHRSRQLAGRGDTPRRTQHRPRRHRPSPRRAPSRHARRRRGCRQDTACACGSPPICGTSDKVRCTWSSWRRCTIRLSTVASVATAVDVHQRQYLSVEETLAEYLRGRNALLVLDNCEHLRVAIAHLVDRMLAACPDLTVLATSREVLGPARANTSDAWSRSPWRPVHFRSTTWRRCRRSGCSSNVRRRRTQTFALDADNAAVDRRDRPPGRRFAARHRARRRPVERHQPCRPRGAAQRAVRSPRPRPGGSVGTSSDTHRTRRLVVQPVERHRADPVRPGVGVRRSVQPRCGRNGLYRRVARHVIGGASPRRARRQVDGPVGRPRRRRVPRARTVAPVRAVGTARLRAGRRHRAARELVPRPGGAVVRSMAGPDEPVGGGAPRPRVRQPPGRLLASGGTSTTSNGAPGSWRRCGSTRSDRCAPRSFRGPTR